MCAHPQINPWNLILAIEIHLTHLRLANTQCRNMKRFLHDLDIYFFNIQNDCFYHFNLYFKMWTISFGDNFFFGKFCAKILVTHTHTQTEKFWQFLSCHYTRTQWQYKELRFFTIFHCGNHQRALTINQTLHENSTSILYEIVLNTEYRVL